MRTYIGNIVSKSYVDKSGIFNVVKELNNIDKRFPTLIIGWDETKKYFPQANILEWRINDMIYWTHKKNIKRSRYEDDIKNYKNILIKYLISYIDFKSFNLFTASSEKINEMLSSFANKQKKYIYLTEKEIYAYYPNFKIVMGISLIEAEYINLSKETLLKSINVPNNKLLYNNSFIPSELKDKMSNKNYIVPFLMQIFENE